jgi:hypothetical protein
LLRPPLLPQSAPRAHLVTATETVDDALFINQLPLLSCKRKKRETDGFGSRSESVFLYSSQALYFNFLILIFNNT